MCHSALRPAEQLGIPSWRKFQQERGRGPPPIGAQKGAGLRGAESGQVVRGVREGEEQEEVEGGGSGLREPCSKMGLEDPCPLSQAGGSRPFGRLSQEVEK